MEHGSCIAFVMTLASVCLAYRCVVTILENLIYLPGVYSGDCHGCAVHRNGGMQNQPGIPSAGIFCLITQLYVLSVALLNINLGTISCSQRCTVFHRYRFLAGDGALRRHRERLAS